MNLVLGIILLTLLFAIFAILSFVWSVMSRELRESRGFRIVTRAYIILVFLLAIFAGYHILFADHFRSSDFHSITHQF